MKFSKLLKLESQEVWLSCCFVAFLIFDQNLGPFLGKFGVIFLYMLDSGKGWKRMVTKACYVGEGFTRKPPKYERFIRPMVRNLKSIKIRQIVMCTINILSSGPDQFVPDRRGADFPSGCIGVLPRS